MPVLTPLVHPLKTSMAALIQMEMAGPTQEMSILQTSTNGQMQMEMDILTM